MKTNVWELGIVEEILWYRAQGRNIFQIKQALHDEGITDVTVNMVEKVLIKHGKVKPMPANWTPNSRFKGHSLRGFWNPDRK